MVSTRYQAEGMHFYVQAITKYHILRTAIRGLKLISRTFITLQSFTCNILQHLPYHPHLMRFTFHLFGRINDRLRRFFFFFKQLRHPLLNIGSLHLPSLCLRTRTFVHYEQNCIANEVNVVFVAVNLLCSMVLLCAR